MCSHMTAGPVRMPVRMQGDTSASISEPQAAVLQSAIRALRDPSLASNLVSLAVMPLPQLQQLLSTHAVDIREVRACAVVEGRVVLRLASCGEVRAVQHARVFVRGARAGGTQARAAEVCVGHMHVCCHVRSAHL